MADTFTQKLDQLQKALEVINTITDNPDLQVRSFEFLLGSHASLRANTPDRGADTDDGQAPEPADGHETNGSGSKARTQRPTTKKASKSSVSQDKTLETAPANVQSWKEFVAEKNPLNQTDKNTSAVYWLKEVAGQEKAGVNQVFTLYIDANWKPPADPKNSLQVTASKDGTLDTADMADIKLAPRGIGLVKNDLPRPDKNKK